MGSAARNPQIVRFADCTLDLRTAELCRNGDKITLQDQPFQILRVLLDSPGQLVTREELTQKLWPSGTFVDFDQSLNKAVARLREALSDDAEKPRFVETLPRRGYRWIGSLESQSGTLSAAPSFRSPAQASDQEMLKNRKLWVVAAVVIMTIALAAGGAFYLRSNKASRIDSIAVLPFTNVGGEVNTDYLSDGITESLIDNLARLPQLQVKSRHSVFRYKGKEFDVQRVGRDLDVNALITGRVTQRGDTIQVSAELTDVRNNAQLWGEQYSRKNTDIVLLQQQIAGDLVEQLRSKLNSTEKKQVTKQSTQSPDAYALFLKGRYYWNKRTIRDIRTATSYFDEAIAKDPSYALAYSGLADAYAVLALWGGNPSETYPKAKAYAWKALQLDPSLAHPHAVLGRAEMEYDWDFAAGEAEYRKALELDPGDATAHQWYAQDILGIGGRDEQAIAEILRAQQLDPASPIITVATGFLRIAARQYDQGIEVCRKMVDENPTFAPAHSCLAEGYWAKRMYPQVIEQYKLHSQLSGNEDFSHFVSALEEGFRSAGWRGALRKDIEVWMVIRKKRYASAYGIARLYTELGDKDGAFRWLDTAYQEHDPDLVGFGVKTDFVFDALRSDPRYANLLRRIGLPQ